MDKKRIIRHVRAEKSAGLFRRADQVRQEYCGDTVHIRGIIEFSNFCVRSYTYCGLRRDNHRLRRYRMTNKEVLDAVDTIAASAIGTIVLQSGDDPGCSAQRICSLVSRIKHRYPDVAVTLSVGERQRKDYLAFRQAGADRYLLKHETANPKLYEFLHPGQTLEARIAILQYLRGIGFELGAGMIVGLPGQTFEDLADDIMFMKSLNVDMAGIGPFIPHKDTPLGDWPAGSLKLTLKTLALARIALPKANLPATTAVATLDVHRGLRKALGCGANVIMCNFTPQIFRKDYRIYDNKEKDFLSADLQKCEAVHSRKLICGSSSGRIGFGGKFSQLGDKIARSDTGFNPASSNFDLHDAVGKTFVTHHDLERSADQVGIIEFDTCARSARSSHNTSTPAAIKSV